MIGLDSFSVHMAHRQGIRSVMLNAGNPPALWAIPAAGGTTLASSGGCPHYPCFNVPKCVGTSYQYACVRSLSVDQVLDSIET
jgi:heptosyltransferase-3